MGGKHAVPLCVEGNCSGSCMARRRGTRTSLLSLLTARRSSASRVLIPRERLCALQENHQEKCVQKSTPYSHPCYRKIVIYLLVVKYMTLLQEPRSDFQVSKWGFIKLSVSWLSLGPNPRRKGWAFRPVFLSCLLFLGVVLNRVWCAGSDNWIIRSGNVESGLGLRCLFLEAQN